jgi:tetratricopeptide (TPR) repeat protein
MVESESTAVNTSSSGEHRSSVSEKNALFSHPHFLKLLISLSLILLTLATFWQVRNNGFINFDDDVYVIENPHVNRGLSFKGILWAFTTTHAGNWHPLTWISHMLDVEIYGLHPGEHHLTSLFLHIANAVLLFLVFSRMTQAPWRSGFLAALFALHPLHVESVAWVAERKDVLSTLFWMLTLWAYVHYAAKPQPKRYLLVALCFVLGLMSKPMVVTLPFVLLLLDYWPLGRFRRDESYGDHGTDTDIPVLPPSRLISEKIPFFALVAFSCLTTLFAQWKGGALKPLEKLPLEMRAANAAVSYVGYLWKTIWPKDLAILYPHPLGFPLWQVVGALSLLVAITVFVSLARRKHSYLLTGWLWYVGTLVPVIGLVQVGIQAMADRYTYVPLIGLFIMISYGLPDLRAGHRLRRFMIPVCGILVLGALVLSTRSQLTLWENDRLLFEHTLRVTKNNFVIHNNLGNALFDQGKDEEAMTHFREALRINPRDARVHNNLAILLAREGKDEEASYHFTEALRGNPANVEIHNSLGVLLVRQGRNDEAMVHYREALRLDPGNAHAHVNLASLLNRQGKSEEAILHYEKALQIKPDQPESHNDLAVLLANRGKIDESIAHLNEAVRIKPDYGEAHSNLGIVLLRKGRIREAADHFNRALQISPNDARVHNNLGGISAHEGKNDEAMAHYTRALQLDPNYGDAHYSLGALLEKGGKTQEAIVHYQEAVRINPNDAEAHLRLGTLLARQGRNQDAISRLNDAIRINPTLGEAYFNLGMIYLRMGKKDLAIKTLKNLESVDPNLAAKLSGEVSK